MNGWYVKNRKSWRDRLLTVPLMQLFKDLLARGSPCTPDFLLLPRGGVLINGRRVRWIDCKTFYGSAALCSDGRLPVGRLLQQARRYDEAFCRPPPSTSTSTSTYSCTIETVSPLKLPSRADSSAMKSSGDNGKCTVRLINRCMHACMFVRTHSMYVFVYEFAYECTYD